MPSKPSHTLFAIFDGHGGAGAAKFAEEHLVRLLEESSEWKAYASNPSQDDPEVVGRVLKQAYFEMDRILRQHQDTNKSADTSGCTAVSAMVTPKYVICVNAGDSRCGDHLK